MATAADANKWMESEADREKTESERLATELHVVHKYRRRELLGLICLLVAGMLLLILTIKTTKLLVVASMISLLVFGMLLVFNKIVVDFAKRRK